MKNILRCVIYKKHIKIDEKQIYQKMNNELNKRGRKRRHIDFNFGNRSFTVKNVCSRNSVTKVTAQNRINEMVANNELRVVGKRSVGRGRPSTVYSLDGADVQKTTAQDFAVAIVFVFDIEKVALAHEANGGIAVSEIDLSARGGAPRNRQRLRPLQPTSVLRSGRCICGLVPW